MKILKRITLLLVITLLLTCNLAFAANEFTSLINETEYTEDFKEWLNLSEAEKAKRIMPRPYNIEDTRFKSNNPIQIAQTVGNSLVSKFSLRDLIPENLIIKNQGSSQACWAFSSLASLETNLALKNYYNQVTAKAYDFSEMHLLYSTSRTFANGQTNNRGLSKNPEDPGSYQYSTPYYMTQMGPINENEMPYKDQFDTIDLSEIQNKTVTAKVYDITAFPSYDLSTDNLDTIKNVIKNHIKQYGGIEAAIHGAQLLGETYNINTGAIYCNDKTKYPLDHDILIIGWDDNYSAKNFNEKLQPSSDGAWIIKNSWGDRYEIPFDTLKQEMYKNTEQSVLDQLGYTSYTDIPDEMVADRFEQNNFNVDRSKRVGFVYLGDKGFMYVSYEDANIYSQMSAIENSSDNVDNDYIYQYDYFYALQKLSIKDPEIYIANIFEKQSNEDEYITEIAMSSFETLDCKVYINPEGQYLAPNNLVEAKLKAGKSEVIEAGYHTIEFAEPIKITGDKFAVVVYAKGTRDDGVVVPLEAPIPNTVFNVIETEDDKCYWTTTDEFPKNNWMDCADLAEASEGSMYNSDLTIKAFTVKNPENYQPDTPDEPDNPDQPDNPQEDNAIPIDFSNAKAEKELSKLFTFTSSNNQEYILMDLKVNDVVRNMNNDSYEYYYYLSTVSGEKNISDWIKISEKQSSASSLSFTIDTRDLSNYSDLLKGKELYIYIKEVVKKGNNTKTTISSGLKINDNNNTEVYKDGVKQSNSATPGNQNQQQGQQTNNNTVQNNTTNSATNNTTNNVVNKTPTDSIKNKTSDNTTANKVLPNTGLASTLLIVMLIVTSVGFFVYKKYNNMEF